MRQLIAPVDALAPYVRNIMAGSFDGERVHLPACADVQLLVYLSGGAWLVDPAGGENALPSVFLVGAVTHPRLYRVAPDSRFVAATFRPGGLHACLGIPASDVTGGIVPFTAIAEISQLAGTSAENAESIVQDALAASLLANDRPALRMPPLDPENLTRPVAELAADMGVSVRQFERHCLASLGMPLRNYRRLARYSAAMTALMMQGASPQALADLALEAHYVDQAHFTRDFSAMVGQPPGRFLKRRDDAQYRLWQFTREELASYLS